MIAARCAALALLLALPGCGRDFFDATGQLSSDGGKLGSWSVTPMGCTRAPAGSPPGSSATHVLTLLWEDPGHRDPRQDNFDTAPNAPLRLEFDRPSGGSAFVGSLQMKESTPGRLDASTCRTLRLETHEQPAAFPEGRPALAGTLTLDCRVAGSHLTGAITFSRCQH